MTRKPWSIEDTRRLVKARYGRDYLNLVNPILHSLSQRLEYAHYHYQEIKRLLNTFSDSHLKTKPLIAVVFGNDQAAREEFEELMTSVEAHATACVICIHTISDILANAVYCTLGYISKTKELKEHNINAYSVESQLRQVPEHVPIADALSRLRGDSHFKHLAALANKCKHQSIVRTTLSEDLTGSRAQRHELRFSTFRYRGQNYPEATVAEILNPAYNIANLTVIEIGNMLNALLTENRV